MNCLVLGGAGFVGFCTCELLLEQGHQVTIYERSPKSREKLGHLAQNVKFLYGDFTTEQHFAAFIQEFDYVFHMICTSLPANENAIREIEENVLATLRLLDACRNSKVRKIIFISSGGSVYGPAAGLAIPETHVTEPICAYGVHKLMIEKYLQLYYHLYGIDYAVMRLANPYGERQDPHRPQGVIAAFISRVLKGQPVEIWGDGTVVRDFLHASDVAQAAVKLAVYEGPEKIFNIGSGQGYSLNQVLDQLELILAKKIPRVFLASRKQDVPVNILDISRAKQELDWKPQVNLAEGMKRVAQAWQKKDC